MISAVRTKALTGTAQGAIIFLHGLGDTGEGWSWLPQLIKQSNLIPNCNSIEYVFPNAPTIPISVNGGYMMPGWFDIFEFGNPNAKQDVDGILKSCKLLESLIKEQMEVNKIPAEKIIIGGFSQGAAISLATAALLDFKIGGVVALSGFCSIQSQIERLYNKSGVNAETPVFQGHGTVDPVIAYDFGKESSEFYNALVFRRLKFHTYSGVAHSASEEELKDVIKFIGGIL
ncbi:uncharacterized protein PRCAT00003976001 [Priceomyces carsonii]|uniref:uncharacterized protein n=1 Tax=Priceomyces carsonii TaxID=28549 RepID=UPI002ED7D500|nr:unnamed protein product [Priceomyces carsonii]